MDNPKNAKNHHISHRFNDELDQIRNRLMEMGGMVEQQLDNALQAVIQKDSTLGKRVVAGDARINRMEIGIEAACTQIIARRQPAASDLRLLITVSKAINDLERIGDEASKIARLAITLSQYSLNIPGYEDVKHIGFRVQSMTRQALTAFTRLDVDSAVAIAQQDLLVDEGYQQATQQLIDFMKKHPESIDEVMALLWSLRALERVGDHARNLAEDVVYLVKGTYVRHQHLDDWGNCVQGNPLNDASDDV